ncbi:MAG: CHAD domain-containing protein [Chloroflexota bacterium]|nr:CHAD domain-containing protein [Chloroflexota bacterium]
MNNVQYFSLPTEYDRDQLFQDLRERFDLLVEKPSLAQWSLYDTFDWRLFHRSLKLVRVADDFFLRDLAGSRDYAAASSSQQFPFAWDFPNGALHEQLTPIIDMRALMALVGGETRSTCFRVLNEDEKTVVRLTICEDAVAAEEGITQADVRVMLQPVRGYDREARTVAQFLDDLGLETRQAEESYAAILRANNLEPGSYSARLAVKLGPDNRSGDATRTIMRALLENLEINLPYIAQDIDTEFLHDFRVSVRRTRTALSQIKAVFPVAETERFKEDFRYFGDLSNLLRDLDVYLLKEDVYRAMLPSSMENDIDPVFDFLHSRRAHVLTEVANGLASQKSQKILRDWDAFLNQEAMDCPDAPNAGRRVADLARESIYRRYRRVVKEGDRILQHENPPDEWLHALRIDCKKLRYLMEFFASLFPAKGHRKLVQQLKRLQDNLGDFNDLSVQQDFLLWIAEEMPVSSVNSRRAVLAIGSLIATLDQRQRKEKKNFAGTFAAFASPPNRSRFKELYGKGAS